MGAAGEDWSDTEIAAVVAAYGEMLQAQRAGHQFVKARFNERVQEATARSKGSVEFKFCNISAVLRDLGWDWVKGYEPRGNYQAALREAVQVAAPGW
jgi:hypothetical protein